MMMMMMMMMMLLLPLLLLFLQSLLLLLLSEAAKDATGAAKRARAAGRFKPKRNRALGIWTAAPVPGGPAVPEAASAGCGGVAKGQGLGGGAKDGGQGGGDGGAQYGEGVGGSEPSAVYEGEFLKDRRHGSGVMRLVSRRVEG